LDADGFALLDHTLLDIAKAGPVHRVSAELATSMHAPTPALP
jgi:hypothetical protein